MCKFTRQRVETLPDTFKLIIGLNANFVKVNVGFWLQKKFANYPVNSKVLVSSESQRFVAPSLRGFFKLNVKK